MKKQLLILFIIFYSINLSAQNNWNISYYQSFTKISSHGNFTWTTDRSQVYKINNSNKQVEVFFDTLKNQSDINCLISRNENAWFSFKNKNNRYFIRHYKSDGTYIEINPADLTNTGIDYHLECVLSTTNVDGTKAFFLNSTKKLIFYIRYNSVKQFELPLNNYSLLKYIDENTLILKSNLNDYYELIDTNGVIKKKINLSTLGISNVNNSIIDIDVDESKNIFFAIKNIGVIKMNCSTPDTTISTFISYPTFGSVSGGNRNIKYTADNNILIINGTVANIYNMSGIYQYNVTNLQAEYNFYYGVNFTISNQHELITTTGINPILYNGSTWTDLYERKNNIETSSLISTVAFGNNGTNIVGTYEKMYFRAKSNIKTSILNDPSPLVKTSISASITDRNGKVWFIKNKYLNELVDNETDIEHLPLPSSLSFTSSPAANLMDVTFDNKIQYLSSKIISNYNTSTSAWENYSIPSNSTITKLYTLANDNNNNTWVGTDKGIARSVNANIELDALVNENRAIACVRYLKNKNAIIYTTQYNYSNFIIFNLNTNTKTTYNFPSTFQSTLDITLITIDKNDNIWFTSNFSGVHRFNTQSLSFDLNFNSSNSIMNDDDIYLIAVDNDNNKMFFTKKTKVCYYYNENNIALNTNIFQAKHTDLFIFPNPSSGLLTIDSKEKYYTYFIYNLFGRLLVNGKIENNKIDISEINSGIYTLKLLGDKGESIQRIVKN